MSTKQSNQQPLADSKKPYKAPRILSKERLEAMANVCMPTSGKSNQGDCELGPISS
jgi:hypothetical protein